MFDNNHTYLDYAATTPVDRRVLDVMLPYFTDSFGNPSSYHWQGQVADAALENARQVVARYMNCSSSEIIFTSCGTESDNLALRGAAFYARKTRGANHILISPVEHHAVSRTAQQLVDMHGFTLEYLAVDRYGRIDVEDVAASIRPGTAVVSVIHANNEIGTINPIPEIGALCRLRGVPFHTDSVQAAGYLSMDVNELQADLVSIGAHKFYGPKGIGALFIRSGTSIYPSQTGGGQEFGLRAGTQNIPYIIGLAEAFQLAQTERMSRVSALKPLRDHLIGAILEEIPSVQLTGHPVERLPNHASFIFKGVDGNALLMMLDVEGFSCSSGSACRTGSPEPSDILTSLGITHDWALGSLRITLGSETTAQDIDRFIKVLPGVIARLREIK